MLRQYNTTQKGGGSLDTVFISSFDCVNSGWKYVTFQINFAALSGGKTLTEDQHGCVIQIGPIFYKWSAPGGILSQTIYGHHDPFITGTPGLEFVLAEVQLRSDTALLDGSGFPTNLREDERTPQVCDLCLTQKPQSMNIPTTLSGPGHWRGAKLKDMHQVDAHFSLDYASRLVALPNIIIWGYKNVSTQDFENTMGSKTQYWTVGASRYDMWEYRYSNRARCQYGTLYLD